MTHTIKKIFDQRTCYDFSDKLVSDELLQEIYDITKLGATSANGSPLRIIFVKSDESKAKLLECLAPMNREKTKNAPISAIFAYDLEFYKYMDILFPHNPGIKSMFENNKVLSLDTAYRNSTLQAAYFMIIAKSYGLDVGPMSGFDTEMVNKAFFDGESLRVNFICNMGYKNKESQFERGPRLDFSKVCKFV
jgi:3-hydroxypropanoate dehydrogenase